MNDITTRLTATLFACASLLTTQACGGGNSSPTVSSGLPKDASVATLSENDAAQLCEATTEAVANAVGGDQLCTFLGAISAISGTETAITIDRAACEAARDECLTSGEVVAPEGDCSSGDVAASLQECSASVGAVEACLNAQLSAVSSIIGRLNCTSAPTMQDVQEFQALQDPDECTSLAATCPDLELGSVVGGNDDLGGDPSNEPSATGCDETCLFSGDNECDDGGEGSDTNFCGLGTDCTDCGPRTPAP